MQTSKIQHVQKIMCNQMQRTHNANLLKELMEACSKITNKNSKHNQQEANAASKMQKQCKKCNESTHQKQKITCGGCKLRLGYSCSNTKPMYVFETHRLGQKHISWTQHKQTFG